MLIKENKKYFLIEKTVLSLVIGWTMMTFLIIAIYTFATFPKQLRQGIEVEFGERIKRMEVNQKINEYYLYTAPVSTYTWENFLEEKMGPLREKYKLQ